MKGLSKQKEQAIALRRRGFSYKRIRKELGTPLSTLNGWFKSVTLTEKQKKRLHKNWQEALVLARKKASATHRAAREKREELLRNEVRLYCQNPVFSTRCTKELALAMLYLGEGNKKKNMGLGNSDPKIIRYYVSSLQELYGIDPSSLYTALHLRADQDEEELKRFWSRESGVPLERFRYVLRDKRTIGKPTYPNYKGVCFIGGGGVEIQRRLLYIADVFCRK